VIKQVFFPDTETRFLDQKFWPTTIKDRINMFNLFTKAKSGYYFPQPWFTKICAIACADSGGN